MAMNISFFKTLMKISTFEGPPLFNMIHTLKFLNLLPYLQDGNLNAFLQSANIPNGEHFSWQYFK